MADSTITISGSVATTPPRKDIAYPIFTNAETPLSVTTPDGSGYITHPDIVKIEGGWNGYTYWMANTPLDGVAVENPCIWGSNDGETWVVPDGLTNPIDGPPATGYFSDTSMIYNADTDELMVWYRQYVTGAVPSEIKIFFSKSSDGVTWSSPMEVLSVQGYEFKDFLSQNVRYLSGTYTMWAIERQGCSTNNPSGGLKIYTSSDGIVWTRQDDGNLIHPENGSDTYIPWHINIQHRVGGGYYGVLNANKKGNVCFTTAGTLALFYVESDDGITFTTPIGAPLLEKSASVSNWDGSYLYQSCLLKDGTTWKLWYTGVNAQSGTVSKMGYVTTNV